MCVSVRMCVVYAASCVYVLVPTKAASGIASMIALPAMTESMMKTAHEMPLTLFLPPAFTLIMDCPIIAHPPIPPRTPFAILPIPWPIHSTCVSERVSVTASTSCCVRRVSMRPTAATLHAVGRMMDSVVRFTGTMGRCKDGNEPAIDAISPTVFVAIPQAFTSIVTSEIAASGPGILSRFAGHTLIITIVSTVSSDMVISGTPVSHPLPECTRNCSSCDAPITRASPFTKPIITG